MNKRKLAILAALSATIIYGLNYTIAKGVMPDYALPFGFILIRVTGGAILFWLLSMFRPKQSIETKDWKTLVAAALLGSVINMLCFFKGLNLTTPINASVIMTLTPILVLVLSAIFIKEHIGLKKIAGIGVGLIGALFLILQGESAVPEIASNTKLGNFYIFLNALFYAGFLIVVKPLSEKYDAVTLMKWLFTIAVFCNLPFGYNEFSQIQWTTMPVGIIFSILYVVACTTFLTYLFNVYALKQLKASTLGVFIYLQPFIATLFAVFMGVDHIDIVKISSATMIFLGVYLVTSK